MSSGSDSDEEYVPGKPEQVSEEESADEETEQQYEEEYETKKNKKRKVSPKKRTQKKRKTGKADTDDDDDDEEEKEDTKKEQVVTKDPEAEKKKDDDLWAKFLEGTDTKPKPTPKPIENKPVVVAKKEEKKRVNNTEERDRRIFEFAGETIVVENNVIKEKIKTTDSPTVAPKLGGPSTPRPGGLSSVLGQINKKSSLSTLEKSKLDWETYKQEEGFQEEVQSINKGKNGYLERQDFLQRADLRQYELEREARIGRRSNR